MAILPGVGYQGYAEIDGFRYLFTSGSITEEFQKVASTSMFGAYSQYADGHISLNQPWNWNYRSYQVALNADMDLESHTMSMLHNWIDKEEWSRTVVISSAGDCESVVDDAFWTSISISAQANSLVSASISAVAKDATLGDCRYVTPYGSADCDIMKLSPIAFWQTAVYMREHGNGSWQKIDAIEWSLEFAQTVSFIPILQNSLQQPKHVTMGPLSCAFTCTALVGTIRPQEADVKIILGNDCLYLTNCPINRTASQLAPKNDKVVVPLEYQVDDYRCVFGGGGRNGKRYHGPWNMPPRGSTEEEEATFAPIADVTLNQDVVRNIPVSISYHNKSLAPQIRAMSIPMGWTCNGSYVTCYNDNSGVSDVVKTVSLGAWSSYTGRLLAQTSFRVTCLGASITAEISSISNVEVDYGQSVSIPVSVSWSGATGTVKVSGLPEGFSYANGVISGANDGSLGGYSFQVKVEAIYGKLRLDSKSFSIKFKDAPASVQILVSDLTVEQQDTFDLVYRVLWTGGNAKSRVMRLYGVPNKFNKVSGTSGTDFVDGHVTGVNDNKLLEDEVYKMSIVAKNGDVSLSKNFSVVLKGAHSVSAVISGIADEIIVPYSGTSGASSYNFYVGWEGGKAYYRSLSFEGRAPEGWGVSTDENVVSGKVFGENFNVGETEAIYDARLLAKYEGQEVGRKDIRFVFERLENAVSMSAQNVSVKFGERGEIPLVVSWNPLAIGTKSVSFFHWEIPEVSDSSSNSNSNVEPIEVEGLPEGWEFAGDGDVGGTILTSENDNGKDEEVTHRVGIRVRCGNFVGKVITAEAVYQVATRVVFDDKLVTYGGRKIVCKGDESDAD